MKNWIWVIIIIGVAGSCLDDPECLRTSGSALRISIKRLSDSKSDTLIVYNITASGADSIFYKNDPEKLDTLVGSALLAVNPYANETVFTFHFETEDKILKVGYKTEARFISEDCGSEQVLYDLTILQTDFDSVRVVNNRLTKKAITNLEILN